MPPKTSTSRKKIMPAHVQIEAGQIQPRKGHVPGAEHQRQHEIAERGGHRRDDEQEDHDRPVQREQAVVGVAGRDDRSGPGSVNSVRISKPKVAPIAIAVEISDQKHQADPLVVARQQPGPQHPAGRSDSFWSALGKNARRAHGADSLYFRLLMNSINAVISSSETSPL